MKIDLAHHQCETGLCITYKREEKKIVISKRKKTYRLTNSAEKQITYFDLDDCVFKESDTENFKLCDYVVVIEDVGDNETSEKFIWLELKGSDLNQACKQILNSYENAVMYNTRVKHYARIVLSKTNKADLRNDSYKKLVVRFQKRFDFSNTEYNKDNSDNLYLKKLT